MVQPFLGFWGEISKPIIGLSPMDGVTDFACRYITAKHGRPDVLFTEFTTAEGLFYAPERILRDFEYSEMERPVVAQIYGHRPEDFYRATHVVCELGFDGVDINMGCPAKSVVQKNCGAMLITVPDLALEILRATRAAVQDWSRGQTLEEARVPQKMIEIVKKMNDQRLEAAGLQLAPTTRTLIPYSLKTRLGYDSIVIEKWVETLLTAQPAVISIHGRTLKQMYKGSSRWDAIGRAVTVAQGSSTLILGNGDLSSLEDAHRVISQTGVDGVLIGRNAIGNPWVFKNLHDTVNYEERIQVAIEHATYYVSQRGERNFRNVRKHLVGYLKNFPRASSFRNRALQTQTLEELKEVLHERNPYEFCDANVA